MKYLKEWSFLWILLISGVVFFSITDSWYLLIQNLVPEGRFQEILNGGIRQEQAGEAWADPSDSVPDILEVSSGNMNADTVENTEDMSMLMDSHTAGVSGNHGSVINPPEKENGKEIPKSRQPEEVKYDSVEDDYFADALFIGDSRTVGLFEYGGLEETASFYASTGLTVYKMFDSPIVAVEGQKDKLTIEEALQENQFSKIYLMIGINEMGTGTVESFMEKYREVIAHLKELQPDAILYLQSVMKVTSQRSEQGDYITNQGIEERNVEIAKLADYVTVYYLDVNPQICDETGGMIPDYTYDGVHLKAQFISIWKDFLKEHAVYLD